MSAIRALLLLVMLLAIAAAPAGCVEPIGGGWKQIKDVSNPQIQELGRWAVAEHARRANNRLRFGRVTRGKVQVVEGMNYKLVLDAADANGATAAYKAFVFEQSWTNTRKLWSFSALN